MIDFSGVQSVCFGLVWFWLLDNRGGCPLQQPHSGIAVVACVVTTTIKSSSQFLACFLLVAAVGGVEHRYSGTGRCGRMYAKGGAATGAKTAPFRRSTHSEHEKKRPFAKTGWGEFFGWGEKENQTKRNVFADMTGAGRP